MVWRTRFLAVPTSQLKQDEQVMPSSKASPEQLRSYMTQVLSVYGKLGQGATAEDFLRMHISPDAQIRAVGDAYYHLFSPAGTDHRLEAEVVDGKGLVVTRGRHRVEAARELGLPYVPVHVRAPDDRTMYVVTNTFEAALSESAPSIVHAQRSLDAEHQAVRLVPERSGAPTAGAGPNQSERVARAMNASAGRDLSSGPLRGRSRT